MSGKKRDAGTESEEAERVVPKEMIACKVCGKLKTMKCGRCKVVAYCGREH
jgi:MYND finger